MNGKPLALFCTLLAAVEMRARAEWPTLHRDNQRSGYTDELVSGPYERKWFRSFVEEMIGARVEPIVAEGLCFVGTYAGNVYALRITDGSTAWRFEAGGAVGHSPCYDSGRLYVATDEAFNRGSLICLDAQTGQVRWRYTASAGIWNSPACDGRQVYVGDRAGVFHAVDADSGRGQWTYRTGYMILKPASIATDGRIIVGSEDMHISCFTPEGRLLWRSAQLYGLSLRDQAPTIWQDLVVVRTNPASPFHEALHIGRQLLLKTHQRLPFDPQEDHLVAESENYRWFRRTERRERAEHEALRDYLRDHPWLRTWFTLRLSDGSEPWITSVWFTSGMHNPPSAPAFNPRTGALYTIIPTAIGVYCSGVSQLGIGIGRVDRRTGYVTNMAHAHGDREPGYFAGMPMIADETSSLSLMDDFLVVTHMGAVGGVDLRTRKIRHLHGRRDTYGGLFGPGAVPGSFEGSRRLAAEGYVQNVVNEWHGPDRSVVAVCDGRFFWVVGGCVVCFAGPAVPSAASGGSQPPKPWKWSSWRRIDGGNLTAPLGRLDKGLPLPVLEPGALEPYLREPPALTSSLPVPEPLAAELRRRLDAEVEELLAGWPWAPLVVELGISGEEVHFWRSAETMRILSEALPFLSADVRAGTLQLLDQLFDAGVPLNRPVLPAAGRRREYYRLPAALLERPSARAPHDAAELGDLYGLWAYAHFAGRWDRLRPLVPELRKRFAQAVEAAQLAPFDPEAEPGRTVERLNRRLAGLIGYVRFMRRAGDQQAARAGLQALSRLAAQRVWLELSDPRLQTAQAHHAWIARYHGLVPETARMLHDWATAPFEANLHALDRELKIWYHAWGERLIGGENYTNSPLLSHAIFMAMASGLCLSAERLARWLDQPWCRADLYYIEKLTAALQSAQRPRDLLPPHKPPAQASSEEPGNSCSPDGTTGSLLVRPSTRCCVTGLGECRN